MANLSNPLPADQHPKPGQANVPVEDPYLKVLKKITGKNWGRYRNDLNPDRENRIYGLKLSDPHDPIANIKTASDSLRRIFGDNAILYLRGTFYIEHDALKTYIREKGLESKNWDNISIHLETVSEKKNRELKKGQALVHAASVPFNLSVGVNADQTHSPKAVKPKTPQSNFPQAPKNPATLVPINAQGRRLNNEDADDRLFDMIHEMTKANLETDYPALDPSDFGAENSTDRFACHQGETEIPSAVLEAARRSGLPPKKIDYLGILKNLTGQRWIELKRNGTTTEETNKVYQLFIPDGTTLAAPEEAYKTLRKLIKTDIFPPKEGTIIVWQSGIDAYLERRKVLKIKEPDNVSDSFNFLSLTPQLKRLEPHNFLRPRTPSKEKIVM